MIREYRFNNLAGCVVQRRCRETGRLVGLYNAEQAGIDSEPGPWATVCEAHGSIANHPTLILATFHLPNPKSWCEICGAGDGES